MHGQPNIRITDFVTITAMHYELPVTFVPVITLPTVLDKPVTKPASQKLLSVMNKLRPTSRLFPFNPYPANVENMSS